MRSRPMVRVFLLLLPLVAAACSSGASSGDGGQADVPDASTAPDGGGDAGDPEPASGCSALFAPPEERVLVDEEGGEHRVCDLQMLCTLDYAEIHKRVYMIVEPTRVSLYTNGNTWEARRAWVCDASGAEELAEGDFYFDYWHHSIFEAGVGYAGYHFRYGHGELCGGGADSCKWFDIFNVYDMQDHALVARRQPAVCVLLGSKGIPRPLVFQQRVPAGGETVVFSMGSEQGEADEQPVHPVSVHGLFVDEREASLADVALFLSDHGNDCGEAACVDVSVQTHLRETDGVWSAESGFEDRPASGLTWFGAQAYCRWRGYFLPTEAEWEMLASAAGSRVYPWGDEPADCERAMCAACGADGPAPVCSRSSGHSREGVCDLAGNLSEWVRDWYQADFYASCPGDCAFPTGPETDTGRKVVRGGSFRSPAEALRAASRAYRDPATGSDETGVRCVIRGGTPNLNY